MPSARTSCSRSRTTRSSTARAPCCGRCPETAGSSWRTSAPTSPSCGPTRASSCCSWVARSARSRSGPSRRELDWWLLDHPEHLGVHRLMKDLNRAYADSPAIWSRDHESDSFEWIDANDAGRNVFSFIRRGVSTGSTSERQRRLVCVSNFAAVPHSDFRLGLPAAGEWREVVNTDAATYTGSGVGNLGVGHRGRGRRERPARPRDAGAAPARHDLAAPRLSGFGHTVCPQRRWWEVRCGTPRAPMETSRAPVVEHPVPHPVTGSPSKGHRAFHNGTRPAPVEGTPDARSRLWKSSDATTSIGVGQRPMPRRVDYVGRFEFIRQAAFAVVRDEGVEALSRRRVAAELGTGVNTIRRSWPAGPTWPASPPTRCDPGAEPGAWVDGPRIRARRSRSSSGH